MLVPLWFQPWTCSLCLSVQAWSKNCWGCPPVTIELTTSRIWDWCSNQVSQGRELVVPNRYLLLLVSESNSCHASIVWLRFHVNIDIHCFPWLIVFFFGSWPLLGLQKVLEWTVVLWAGNWGSFQLAISTSRFAPHWVWNCHCAKLIVQINKNCHHSRLELCQIWVDIWIFTSKRSSSARFRRWWRCFFTRSSCPSG